MSLTGLSRPLNLLWLIDLDYQSGMRHGGNLRWFSLSQELVARGHRVYFAINRAPASDLAGRTQYLEELRRSELITGHFVVDYRYPPWRARAGQLVASHPMIVNRLLNDHQEAATAAVTDILTRYRIDLLFVSDRAFLFLIPRLSAPMPVVVDWVDSFTLYFARSAILNLRLGRPRALVTDLRNLAAHCFQERYYGRQAAANLLVSPIDKRCFDRVTGSPPKNHVLLNGVSSHPSADPPTKIPARLIFTGNMNFPPNYQGAIWFIDHVLPQLHKRRPDITFVVAGRNPVPALLARASASVRVLGAVEDMRHEIAQSALYVAPLISGGGFKNKILEALMAGTFVVATPLAVEFLDDAIRQTLLVATTPVSMTQQILFFLKAPHVFDARLPSLTSIITERFKWHDRAGELLGLITEIFRTVARTG